VATERDQAERRAWWESIGDRDPAQFVFVDESSANITLTPRSARAPKGERAYGAVPRNYRHNLTLVAALIPAGMQASMTLEGPLDGDAFAAYVQHVLVPTLQPGQVVILDNLSVHKRLEIRLQIEQVGATLLFLPAYSPDFSPIEQAFSKLKSVLRRVQARTQEALEVAIAEALATISATDAVHWFRHGGYQLKGQPL
jgi:transposase